MILFRNTSALSSYYSTARLDYIHFDTPHLVFKSCIFMNNSFLWTPVNCSVIVYYVVIFTRSTVLLGLEWQIFVIEPRQYIHFFFIYIIRLEGKTSLEILIYNKGLVHARWLLSFVRGWGHFCLHVSWNFTTITFAHNSPFTLLLKLVQMPNELVE